MARLSGISLFSATILSIFLFYICNGKELDYLRSLDDSISYRLSFRSADENHPLALSEESGDEGGEKDGGANVVRILSADKEQYRCFLPTIAPSSKKRIESYHGPSPAELLQSIYAEQICSYRIEPYWSYELCHGRYVLQYHEDKESKQRIEYYLGNFVGIQAEMEARLFDQLNPPMRKIGDEMLAYYPVTYTHGTVCDLTGKPRQTIVMYVCDEDSHQNVQSFSEVSSCKYEMVVLSNEICAHPSFQRPTVNEYEIKCYSMEKGQNEEDDSKPKALRAVEEEQKDDYLYEFGLYKKHSSVGAAKDVFSKILKVDENIIEDGFNQLQAILEAIKKKAASQQQDAVGEEGNTQSAQQSSLSSREGQPPAQQELAPPKNDAQTMVERFWRGELCLSGGTGWWRYEVCNGKSVSQWHEEPAKERQTIMLGTFDLDVHKAWATEHPEKAVERKLDGRVMQVTHMYVKGDVCTETGAHRDCQVRIRCREDIDAQKVFVYMLEPNTCSYIIVLESPIFCNWLQNVDQFGLMVGEEMTASSSTQQAAKEKPKQQQRKVKTAAIEIDLLNHDEILRIVRELMDGDGQEMVISATKVKLADEVDEQEEAGDEEVEGREEEGQTEVGAETKISPTNYDEEAVVENNKEKSGTAGDEHAKGEL